MRLRRFNDVGIERFRTHLSAFRADNSSTVPVEILFDDALTEVIEPETDTPDETFSNRFAVASYLDRLLTPVGLADAFQDVGLWSWLALRFFDQLCPVTPGKARSPGEDARWIPQVDESRRYYRHLLLGPCVIYQPNRDDPRRVVGLLTERANIATSEVFRSFVENPSLIRARSAVAAATSLYYDPESRRLRRGAATKVSGGCRRLISVLQQFDCTYDLYALPEQTLLSMLPQEFDRFRPQPTLLGTV